MKKSSKKPVVRKKRGTYDDKIQVKEGTTFMDLIGAVVKDAEKKENDNK